MKVIQFPHPGNEHHYSKKELADGIKNYNSKKSHERNFIHANGTYIATNGVPQKESLTFWGEWEMYARVSPLNNTQNGFPRYIIIPNLNKNTGNDVRNSDPCVFGEEFKYYCCRQKKSKLLKNLDEGSVIIFGSSKGMMSNEFYVDTVFVVKEAIPFNSKKLEELRNSLSDYDLFYENSLKELETSGKCTKGEDFVLYKGATFDNPAVNGLYSFTPSKIFNTKSIGFERVKISKQDISEINPRLTRNIKQLKNSRPEDVWNVIKTKTEQNNLFPAVKVDWPSGSSAPSVPSNSNCRNC